MPKKNQDDVFMDENEDFGYAPAEPDFFDDLLQGGAPVEPIVKLEEQPPPIKIEPVSIYIAEKYSTRK